MTGSDTSLSEMSYEQAFSELETLVETLEEEQKPLEEALKLYERGQLLIKYCGALLEQADLRIRQLNPAGSDAEAGSGE